MKENYKTQEKIYDAEVLESSTFDENIIIKILIKAGRTIAKPALEVLEMALDPYTPAQVRVSLMAALAYLIMPFDLCPDFMPIVGFSDDFVALTAVLSIWSKYMYLLHILSTAVRATKSSLKPTIGIKSGQRSNGIIKYARAAINETLTCAGV